MQSLKALARMISEKKKNTTLKLLHEQHHYPDNQSSFDNIKLT